MNASHHPTVQFAYAATRPADRWMTLNIEPDDTIDLTPVELATLFFIVDAIQTRWPEVDPRSAEFGLLVRAQLPPCHPLLGDAALLRRLLAE